MSIFSRAPDPWAAAFRADEEGAAPPVKVTKRAVRKALEEALMVLTRADLEPVLAEEFGLAWTHEQFTPAEADTKRALIDGYIGNWGLPQLVAFARRVVNDGTTHETHEADLRRYIGAYERGGGVEAPAKNLIFAANGPKPELVLRDAVSNEIEIVANAEHCLVWDRPVPPEGLRFSQLISWWREREQLPETSHDDRAVGLALHERLAASLASKPERVVFDAYASRYKASYDIPALVPQVYLHYDPYNQRTRRSLGNGTPLARQRMDFLLLYSDTQRVVIEVDGKQHYADGDIAKPKLYSEMVAEDRKLRLAGYEVYRFGGYELTRDPAAAMKLVADFFEDLAARMK